MVVKVEDPLVTVETMSDVVIALAVAVEVAVAEVTRLVAVVVATDPEELPAALVELAIAAL